MLEVSGGDMHSFFRPMAFVSPISTSHRRAGRRPIGASRSCSFTVSASNHAVNWVNTMWVTALSRAGRRVIALDNRGHGKSEKLYDPAAYDSYIMAEDAIRLLDHLDIARADVMGYFHGCADFGASGPRSF